MPSPFILALNRNQPKICGIFLNHDSSLVDDTDPEGWPVLHVAAEVGNLWAVEELIKRKVDANVLFQGITALDLASRHDQWKVVSFLRNHTSKEIEVIDKKVIQLVLFFVYGFIQFFFFF